MDFLDATITISDIAVPQNVLASDGTHGDKVVITWDDIAGETGYDIYRHTTDDSSQATKILSAEQNAVTEEDTNAIPGRRYYYWVQSTKTSGGSVIRSNLSGPDAGYASLSTPQNLAASDGTHTDKVTLTWEDVVGETGYEVYRHTADNSAQATKILSVGQDTVAAEDTNVVIDQTYYYWVKAVASAGGVVIESPLSSPDQGSAQPPPDLVRYILKTFTVDGSEEITMVGVGEVFQLQVWVEDLRVLGNFPDDHPNPVLRGQPREGVFAGYLDVIYDAALAAVDGPLVHNFADYGNSPTGDASVAGVIDGAGSFRGSSIPTGPEPVFLWSLDFVATTTGELTFVGEPTTDSTDPGDAGQSPSLDTNVYDDDRPVCPSSNSNCNGNMVFQDASLTVIAPFPWQNSAQREDSSGDGVVAPNDVLIIVNYLNEVDPDHAPAPPPYLDVSGDGTVAPNDVLIVVNFLNDPANWPQPEGESSALDLRLLDQDLAEHGSASLPQSESHAIPSDLLAERVDEILRTDVWCHDRCERLGQEVRQTARRIHALAEDLEETLSDIVAELHDQLIPEHRPAILR
jgi:hypothetical protein